MAPAIDRLADQQYRAAIANWAVTKQIDRKAQAVQDGRPVVSLAEVVYRTRPRAIVQMMLPRTPRSKAANSCCRRIAVGSKVQDQLRHAVKRNDRNHARSTPGHRFNHRS